MLNDALIINFNGDILVNDEIVGNIYVDNIEDIFDVI